MDIIDMAAVSSSNRARSSLLGSNKARRKLRGHLENIAIDGRHLYSVLVPFYFDCVVYQSSKFFLFLTTDRISLDAIRRTTRHGGRNDDIDSHSERFGQSRYHLYSFLQQGKCYANLIVGSIEDGINSMVDGFSFCRVVEDPLFQCDIQPRAATY